jgi:iron(III) transport system ATP-binding protein
MTQLAVSGLDKAFGGRSVLTGVDLEVPENSLTAILGPSGSGKTTLLRVIVGFEHADGGTVQLGGKIVQCAAPQDLYTRPADPEVARFTGEANLVDGVLGEGAVETLLGALPVQASKREMPDPGPVTVLVRPEQIEISEQNGTHGLTGRIVALGYHGHDAVVHVEPEQQPGAAAIVVRTLGGCELPAGARVTLRARGPVPAWPRAQVA